MKLTKAQYLRIKWMLPIPRGNVRVDNLTFLNALLYAIENGCKWRALPKEFGKWSTIYKRFRRWSETGVLERVFDQLKEELLLEIDLSVLSLDSTSIKASPDATRALKKRQTSDRTKSRRSDFKTSRGRSQFESNCCFLYHKRRSGGRTDRPTVDEIVIAGINRRLRMSTPYRN